MTTQPTPTTEGTVQVPEEFCAGVIPMEQWVRETPETEEFCPPCLMGPLTQWYVETLKESGEDSLAQQVEQAAGNVDLSPEQLAQTLDEVKTQAPEATRAQLMDLDCSVQTYDPDEEDSDG